MDADGEQGTKHAEKTFDHKERMEPTWLKTEDGGRTRVERRVPAACQALDSQLMVWPVWHARCRS
jgi:hypothetical protein